MGEPDNEKSESIFSKIGNGAFLFGVATIAGIGSFGMVLTRSRKSSPADFDKNIESGSKLAMRALKRATFYSVGGFSLFCYGIWTLMGVKNLKEFTAKMQSITPKVPPAKSGDGKEVDWDEIFGTKPEKDAKK